MNMVKFMAQNINEMRQISPTTGLLASLVEKIGNPNPDFYNILSLKKL
jgi:hypothetical protein